MGLLGATGIGIGAIVGGGILALAGVAFATTGPSAIAAFAGNGLLALLTALSFAELSARFPEPGGTYTFARKVLTVEAAFAVGWVVWFASVVAAVLYALGFAAFLVPVLEHIWTATGAAPPTWLGSRFTMLIYALGAVGFYTWSLSRYSRGGRPWATIGKLVMFGILLVGGAFMLAIQPPGKSELSASFRPFLANGVQGLLQAMGYTFIALQGFDLIPAVSGEIRQPEKTVPRAMIVSLLTALAIYLPLLFLIITIGTPGRPVAEVARDNPEIIVATAAHNFLGPVGYWLVILAGLLSMLSALHANLFAASRYAMAMARDRTLPHRFGKLVPGRHTPVRAIRLTGAMAALVLVAVPDVAAAGAMASLIFLASFALAHGIAYLARRRVGANRAFLTPAFPLVPAVGGTACVALALFQALAVPAAGALAALWLSLGAVLFVTRIGARARVFDASSEAMDPQLVKLRGRSPLVLVPIANPANTETLVTMANALAPQAVARVLLLSVVRPPENWVSGEQPQQLTDAQSILGSALSTAFAVKSAPQALITIGEDPWKEIADVASSYRCESLLLGLGNLEEDLMTGPLEKLISEVETDVVILRAPGRWDPKSAENILVPSGGRRDQSPIRARLLGSICRSGKHEVTYLRVLTENQDAETEIRIKRELKKLARDEAPGISHVEVFHSQDLVAKITDRARASDLLILGLQRLGRRNKVFGERVLEIARRTDCPLMMISRRS
ncbi:MAG: amino acid permease [Deltaproteobacteria bacterium]|nr:amino acid permease [Deltaproteobacteria bacterium]